MSDSSDEDSFATGGALDALARMRRGAPDDFIGKLIGDYRVTGLIAEGGMGRVFLAERVDGSFERDVAIKVAAAGFISDTIKTLFLREQSVLATLNHPHITQLYDARISDEGWPYIVMEYVDGETIVEWSRRHTREECIRLLAKVVEAVAYAHARLIVHRDIKPSNVLVTRDGEPKLLDFGIAKLLEQDTGDLTRAVPMTPDYASPEQLLRQPVTVASDIFQLGLLVHEVLTGRKLSRGATLAEATQAAAEDRPVAVDSESRSALPRELVNIIEQCLRGSADERYRDAGALADDLRAWLDGFPVSAAGPGAMYRARKFARRNVSTIAVIAVALIALTGSSVWYLAEVTRQRDIAREQETIATESLRFLSSIFEAANPYDEAGEPVTARDLLDEGAARIETELTGQPGVQQRLFMQIGLVYLRLGALDQAQTYVEKVIQAHHQLEQAGGQPNMEMLIAGKSLLAVVLEGKGEYDSAEVLYAEVIELGREWLGPDHIQVQNAIENQNYILGLTGRVREARDAQAEMYAYKLEHFGPDSADTLGAVVNLAFLQKSLGEYEAALELASESLPIAEEALGEYNYVTVNLLLTVASAHYNLGEYDKAHPLFEEHLRRQVQIHGENSPEVFEARVELGQSFDAIGESARSESILRDVLADLVDARGEEFALTMQARAKLAQTLLSLDRPTEAHGMLVELLPRLEAVAGATGPETLFARLVFARSLVALDDTSARQYCDELMAVLVDELGSEHRYTRQLSALREAL